jgi:hypothetical protein
LSLQIPKDQKSSYTVCSKIIKPNPAINPEEANWI